MNFRPAATLDMLRRRAELLQRVRHFFDSRGFLEVETPLLSRDVVVDRHLDPLSVTLFADPREPQRGETLWLQTSPEFGMKRLLAAFPSSPLAPRGRGVGGEGVGREGGVGRPAPSPEPSLGALLPNPPLAIYQIARAFRGGETGRLHNPEFTLLEWYRSGDDYLAGMNLLEELAQALLHRGPAERLSFQDAFLKHAGLDPLSGEHDQLALDRLLVEQVEPHLGKQRPTILYDYPADQAALARVRPGDPPVAERFELYVDGIELANGYHELLDPAVLRARNRANNALRAADGKYVLPEESQLLSAMEHGLPPCAGCALGFDRLVMVATGAASIQEVIAFPGERA